MILANAFTVALIGAGLFFFIAGTAGLLRFPGTHGRLHALTKADSLGLGMIALGLTPQVGSLTLVMKLALVWMLAVLAAATASQLIARTALPPALRGPTGRMREGVTDPGDRAGSRAALGAGAE